MRRSCDNPIDWNVHRVQDLRLQQIIDYVEWTNSSSCRLTHHLGGHAHVDGVDGQKAVCMDPSVRPEKESECLVYSFGISNDWTFDEAMEQMGCRVVYAFDPSMNVDNHDHSSKIDAVDWEGYNAYEIVWFNSKLARTDATHSVLPSMVNKKKMYNPVNVNKK